MASFSRAASSAPAEVSPLDGYPLVRGIRSFPGYPSGAVCRLLDQRLRPSPRRRIAVFDGSAMFARKSRGSSMGRGTFRNVWRTNEIRRVRHDEVSAQLSRCRQPVMAQCRLPDQRS
jgi:hypothetical protein